MPRAKKAAGTAADKRNGARLELPAAGQLRKFGLPRRPEGWQPESGRAWRALWDDAVSSAWTSADRPVLLMLVDAFDRRVRMLRDADADPVVKGSQGQPVEHPAYAVAAGQYQVVKDCLAQLGAGPLNRARLGYSIGAAKLTLMDLARQAPGNLDQLYPDPRLVEDPRPALGMT
jgi:P27 family predicted phage terminase small subunit